MNQGGITERLIGFCNKIVGHITGGLAIANVVASMLFAGISERKEEIPCRRSNDPCPWSYGERDSIKTREIWGVLPDAPILQ